MALGINRVTYLKYTNLPGIIGERLFNICDKNKDGYLDFEEFSSAIIKICSGDSAIKMKLVFQLYDFDDDGQSKKKMWHQ